jgi:hypothetical protein
MLLYILLLNDKAQEKHSEATLGLEKCIYQETTGSHWPTTMIGPGGAS